MKKTTLLTLLVAAVYLPHQDFWNWKKIEPFVLGFLPMGLADHVGYSLVVAATMALLVRFACSKQSSSPNCSTAMSHPNSLVFAWVVMAWTAGWVNLRSALIA